MDQNEGNNKNKDNDNSNSNYNDNDKKIIRKVITGNRTIQGAVSTKDYTHTIIPKSFGFMFSTCLDPPLQSAQKDNRHQKGFILLMHCCFTSTVNI